MFFSKYLSFLFFNPNYAIIPNHKKGSYCMHDMTINSSISSSINSSVKLISWNVNGMRAILKKGFESFVQQYDPDIICLQEVKAEQEQVELVLPGYEVYWNAAKKKGYSGTAIYTRIKAQNVSYGIQMEEHDQEGRVVTLEFKDVYLVNLYTPNSKDTLARLDYRTQEWEPAFLRYVKQLEFSKPVIFCGDLNVAHTEIDLARPAENQRSAGFTPEERQSFERVLAAGFLDTFRIFDPNPGRYTWWSYRANARERNVGWRIDYFCISPCLRDLLQHAAIHPEVLGSDHCPVSLQIDKRIFV